LDCEELLRAAADRVGPSVVRVEQGSGTVIGEGRVLTNAHVLDEGTPVTVAFAGGRSVPAKVLGADLDDDLAVLEPAEPGGDPIRWEAGAGGPRLGQLVVVVAATCDGGVRVTAGHVSAVGRSFRGPGGRPLVGFEHTALGKAGPYSGGPVVDVEGRLLGVDTECMEGGIHVAIVADSAMAQRVERLSLRS
jgi:S1-C subfamily serine protease